MMITEEEYARDCLNAGSKGHFHDGVWWQQPFPFYAKPMFEFHTFAPGRSRPSWSKALLGYSHHVPDARLGNRTLEYMILQGKSLRDYDLGALPGKKRNQVRKGLRCCDVMLIEEKEIDLEEIRQIYLSQATRHTEHHERPDTPPSFYIEHKEEWQARERRYLTSCGREIWGAFAEGKLVAFIVTSQVEDVRFIEKVKLHTDYMSFNPIDALYFRALEAASGDAACGRVVNPGIRGGRLAKHKEQFLFKRTSIPVYVSNLTLFTLARRVRAVGTSLGHFHPRRVHVTKRLNR